MELGEKQEVLGLKNKQREALEIPQKTTEMDGSKYKAVEQEQDIEKSLQEHYGVGLEEREKSGSGSEGSGNAGLKVGSDGSYSEESEASDSSEDNGSGDES